MNKAVFILFLSTLFFLSCTEIKTEYYPNGELKSEQTYKKDKLHGVSYFYYNNGNLQSEFLYVNGVIEGESKRYYINGKTELSTFYKDGKKHGISKSYNKTGKLITEENYQNGVLHGPFKAYFPNGKIQIEGTYKDGFYQGKWMYYNDMGFSVGEGNFESGTGIQKGFYFGGQVKREVEYKENEKHGTEKSFSKEGKLIRIDYYDMGNYLRSEITTTNSTEEKSDKKED